MIQGNKSRHFFSFSSIAWIVFGLAAALVSLQANVAAAVPSIKSASEYDYPPFAIVTKDGQADGFSVELLREALHSVGRDVQFKVGPWHKLKQELAEGHIQVLPLVGRNAERQLVYDFTSPYMSMHGTLIARKGDSRIRGLDDVRDKALVVLKGDNAGEYAREHKLTDKLVETETLEIGLRQLAVGQHDAMLVQKLVGENLIKTLGLSNLETVGPPIEHFQDFCFAVRLGDKELLATLNEGLALIIANGTVERLREKWITPTRDEFYARLRQQLAIALGLFLLAAIPAYLIHRSKLAEVNRRAVKLAESEEKYRSLYSSMIEGLALHEIVMDQSGKPIDYRILDVNPAFEKHTGLTRSSTVGRLATEAFGTAEPPFLELYAEVAQTRRPKVFNKYFEPMQKHFVISVFSPQPQQFATVFEDITESKNASDELERHRIHLEELIESRTAELARAKIVAEAASIAKSAFLANMSHEIRTPMNAILGMASILRREGVSPKQAERLDKIDHAAEHLLSIINDVLDISKIEAGKFVIEEMPVAISSLLSNVVSILFERARAKGIQLLVEPNYLPPNLYSDPTRIQQALFNYASNAIKFTEKGTVTLRTVKQEEAAESVLVRFEVIDTGIGIPTQTLPRLFSTFEQADNTTTRKYGGTGLGLAITRRLAELMGGEAGAESAPGGGSTFWFTVRLKKGAKITQVQQVSKAHAATEMRRYQGSRILIADDEPVNLEIAKTLLEDVGILADTAHDGAEAIVMTRDTTYAAILMDMQMPNMNGLEATRVIRELPEYGKTPIIAVTANAFAEDRRRCIDAGMNDVLIKPFNPNELYTSLLKWLPSEAAKGDPRPGGKAQASESRISGGMVRSATASFSQVGGTEAVLERLAGIPGLEEVRVLEELGGNAEKYINLLTKFVESHRRDSTRLAEALAVGDKATALKIVHALGGSAATLGAGSLADAARRLEAKFQKFQGDNILNDDIRTEMNAISLELNALETALLRPT